MISQTNIHTLKTGQFQLSYMLPHTRRRKRHKYQTFEEAQEAQKITEQKFSPSVSLDYANHLIKGLMNLHLQHCPDTRVNEKKICLQLFLERFGESKLKEVTKVELVRWLSEIKASRNLSIKTLKLWAGHINHFFIISPLMV